MYVTITFNKLFIEDELEEQSYYLGKSKALPEHEICAVALTGDFHSITVLEECKLQTSQAISTHIIRKRSLLHVSSAEHQRTVIHMTQ